MRIVVVANKHWESDPLVGVLVGNRATPRELRIARVVNHPFFMSSRPLTTPLPRLEAAVGNHEIEVWCIQDLMSPNVSSSSTLEKARVLPAIERYKSAAPELVVAFGTAGAIGDVRLTGSVIVGSSVFLHNPYSTSEPAKHWEVPRPDVVLKSETLPNGIFRALEEDIRFPAEGRFLEPPIRPADPPVVIVGETYVALSNVNITDYDDYGWADVKLLQSFERVTRGRARIGSLETTHGVIRELVAPGAPFIYVSGIANTIGRFDYDVAPRLYAQNLVAAHNAGVALAWMLPSLVEQLERGANRPGEQRSRMAM